jgi:hypothetical protein
MDSTVTHVGAPDAVPVDRTKHVNYTFGMVLGVEDFVQDFTYLTARDQLIARELIGYGTVWGLAVDARPDPADPDLRERVTVTRGLAIVPPGQPVCVPVDQCAYIAPWLRTHADELDDIAPSGGLVPVYVVLCYRDRATDDVPIPGEPCRSEDELMAPSRRQDDFALELRLRPPPQVEEDAIRDVVDWLRLIPVITSGGSSIDDILDALRAAAAAAPTYGSPPDAWGSPPDGSPPDGSPPDGWGSPPAPFDALLGAPDPSLAIPADAAPEYLREVLRVWVTELRPRWRLDIGCGGSECGPGIGTDLDCLLLAELSIPIAWDSGTPITTGGAIDVIEARRPFLVHQRMLQEWLLTTPAGPASGIGSPPELGGSGGLGVVVAAGRVGPAGGLTTPPQFGTAGLAVTHLGTGIYRLTFAGYDQAHRYVVSGSPVTSLADAPRLLETVVDGSVAPPLDASLGLHIRISSITGTAVDSPFAFQVSDYSAAP